jgi:hypothetical protein
MNQFNELTNDILGKPKEETFLSLVAAVEENNSMHDGKWSDWEDSFHIEDVYGNLEGRDRQIARKFLDCLIRDNGDNRLLFMEIWDIMNQGYGLPRK